jgi:hypothetical protein
MKNGKFLRNIRESKRILNAVDVLEKDLLDKSILK